MDTSKPQGLFGPEEERDFIRDHLGPELEKSGDLDALFFCKIFGCQKTVDFFCRGMDLKLIAWDHNRDELVLRAQTWGKPSKGWTIPIGKRRFLRQSIFGWFCEDAVTFIVYPCWDFC